MADDPREPVDLAGRLDAYSAWVRELSDGKNAEPPQAEGEDHLARLGQELKLLSEGITRRENELRKLFQLVHKVERGILVDDVLDQIFVGFSKILPFDRIGCAFLADGGARLTAYWARTNLASPQITKGYSQPLAGSSLQEVFRSGEPRIINDLQSYLATHPKSDSTRRIVAEGGRSNLSCPLFVNGHPLGVLFFTSREKNVYRDIHQAVFRQIAEEVATVVNNSRLFQQLVDSNQFLVRQAEQLKVTANRDALTGVLNRGAIMAAFEQQVRATGPQGKVLGVIMVDIDHFKRINDTYGHPAGDTVLREFTRRLAAVLRPNDFLGRYGGEEFLILIGDTDSDQLLRVANRLRSSIAEAPFDLAIVREPMTASFGLALASDPGASAETLTAAADKALYAAKNNGRNRCELT